MEIENSILKKMNEFERNTNLIGWIRASESTDSVLLSEEVARLSKENHELREYVNILNTQIQISSPDLMMHGYSFSEILEILNKSLLSEQDFTNDFRKEFSYFDIESLDSGKIESFLIEHLRSGTISNLTHFILLFSDALDKGITLSHGPSYESIIFNSLQIKTIFDIGIVEFNITEKQVPVPFTRTVIRTTSNGSSFIKYLKIKMLKEKMLLA
jgi:hypothetical protein